MFIQEYLSVANAVLPVFITMGLGGYLRYKNHLSQSVDASLFKLVVNLFFPCLIFDVVIGNPVLRLSDNIIYPPLLGSLSIVIGLIIAAFFASLFVSKNTEERQSFIYATSIYNYGYIGISLTQLIFDRATVGVLFVYNLGVEITMWTLASIMLKGTHWRESWKSIANPPSLAIIASVTINALLPDSYFPTFLKNSFHVLGTCAIPIAILVVGATLADFLPQLNWKSSFRMVTGGILLRLLIIPSSFLLGAWALPISTELKRVLIIQSSMPAAMLPIVIIKQHKGDIGTAIRVMLSTTAISLLTIPLVIRLGLKLCGIN